jgi:flagellar biosynthesis GTPase FlhF
MELKRIIAKDTRTANEKAMALYGSDVLIISSCQVRGQTELIVAVDIEPMSGETAVKEEFIPSDLTYSTKKDKGQAHDDDQIFVPAHQKLSSKNNSPKSFDEVLEQTLKQNKRIERSTAPKTESVASKSVKTQTRESAAHVQSAFVGPVRPVGWRKATVSKIKAKIAHQTNKLSAAEQTGTLREQTDLEKARDERDLLRGKEIVDLVREELATLRKEFKLSQQLAMWQSSPLSRNLQPLRNALNEAPIPAALRALLIDSIQSFDEVEPALQEIKRQLCSSMQSEHTHASAPAQLEGVQVIAGPSGSGKTLMVARLAQDISADVGCEQVAVISYSDLRAGAWNQAQLLSAQSGVDCFRANNPATLKLLLEEHAHKKVIFIDTPGVQMADKIAEIASVCPQAQFHAVLPADVSLTTLRKTFAVPDIIWQSLMISKLDESCQPWPLIQCLTEGNVAVSVAGKGERIGDWIRQVKPEDLVNLALSNLSLSHNDVLKEDSHQSMDMARIARLASQLTGSKHE